MTLEQALESTREFNKEWIRKKKVPKEQIKENYDFLIKVGLTDGKIASQAQLLGMNPETIKSNYESLKELGLKDSKIANQAQLLGMNPETIKSNYNNFIGLTRNDYKDRNSGKEIIFNQISLLGSSQKTIESNIQFFNQYNLHYGDGFMFGTTVNNKRKKLAYILREVFDYKSVSENQKKDTINDLYAFVRKNPKLLRQSISTLKKRKERLRKVV